MRSMLPTATTAVAVGVAICLVTLSETNAANTPYSTSYQVDTPSFVHPSQQSSASGSNSNSNGDDFPAPYRTVAGLRSRARLLASLNGLKTFFSSDEHNHDDDVIDDDDQREFDILYNFMKNRFESDDYNVTDYDTEGSSTQTVLDWFSRWGFRTSSIKDPANNEPNAFSVWDSEEEDDAFRTDIERRDGAQSALAAQRAGTVEGLHLVSAHIPLSNVYFGAESIDRNNPFQSIYDSGSSWTWVIGAAHNPSATVKYNGSVTSNSDFHVKYFVGEVSGSWTKDDIKINNLRIPKQDFGVIIQTDNDLDNIMRSGVSSVIGLALGDYRKDTLYENIMKQNLLDNNVFSYVEPRRGIRDGEVGIGTCNSLAVSTPLYCFPSLRRAQRSHSPRLWFISMQGVKFNGKYLGERSDSRSALVDTGSSFIGLPQSAYEDLRTSLGSDLIRQDDDGTLIVKCTASLPPLVFVIDKYEFEVNPSAYRSMIGGQCKLLLMQLGKDFVTLGSTFFKSYHVLFDFDHQYVGFSGFGDENLLRVGSNEQRHPCSCKEGAVNGTVVIRGDPILRVSRRNRLFIFCIAGAGLVLLVGVAYTISRLVRRRQRRRALLNMPPQYTPGAYVPVSMSTAN